jgi:hypothetical protein
LFVAVHCDNTCYKRSEDEMLVWVLVGTALAAAVAVVAARWPVGPARRERMAHTFARKVDLALGPELVPLVGERLVRRARLAWGSAGLPVAFMVIFFAWGGASLDGPGVALSTLGFIAILQLSQVVGELALQALEYARQGADRPRTAHIARPRIDDFVTPLELWWSRGSALVAVLAAGFHVVRDPGVTGAPALLVACAVVWLLVEVAARALVAARPAASDVQSLAFDDALRARMLRALLGSTGFLAFAVASAGTSLSRPFGASYYALMLVYLASFVPQIWADSSVRARLHYKARLWPSPVR